MQTILITGGTGLIGTRLTQLLNKKGYNVIILSRERITSSSKLITYAYWDINNNIIDEWAISNADHIIHLAGEPAVSKRWTKARKKEIVFSRTQGSHVLFNALSKTPNRVKAVISSSAIGWYGEDTPDSYLSGFEEGAPADTAFLGETCRLWENSIQPVKEIDKRLVILRTGIVLSNKGGAFPEFKKMAERKVVGILGRGQQVISWIHVDDLCDLFIFCIEHNNISGIYNAVSPNPITNQQLLLKIAGVKQNDHSTIHIPAFIIKMLIGEMSIEVLKSTTVSARKILAENFDLTYAGIDEALNNLLNADNN